ncbi:hypothetical protein SMACR_06981 [Sordaria macrospora]|nr:hypothetical protein SMACR_06981 [Sordaria macrospora]WPJ67197.1 hypothetical protein SMAC4_06981 [Sordaria macrospora]
MARSSPFTDLLGCCFAVSLHDSHREDRNNDSAKENGNNDAGKRNDKHDKMADKAAGPKVGFNKRNPSLCRTCRKVNFNSLFRSHDCSITSWPNNKVTIRSHQPECPCGYEFISRTNRFKGLLGKLDSHAPTCSLCAFLYQCQVRLDLVPTKQERWYCIVMPHLSLEGITLQAPGSMGALMSHGAQDVAALHLRKLQKGRMGRVIGSSPTPQLILRMVDNGSNTLTRGKGSGSGLLGRKLDPDRFNFNLIGKWLKLCQSTHSQCEEVDADFIAGLLVIDCTTGWIIPLPPRENDANRMASFVTLSYLWGTAGTVNGPVVQSMNRNGVSGPALPSEIPLDISDAMRVVSQLGYRYLWVDRYCIPQDDEVAKQIQILNMGRIYSTSTLTIIAAAGEGPEYGLPGVSSRSRTPQLGVKISDEISLVLYEAPMDTIANSKWNTRGWTYQEGLLSKRRLVFTDLMVYFQCQEMHGDEVLSLPIPGPGEEFDEVRALSFGGLTHHQGTKLRMVFPRTSEWHNPLTVWERLGEYGLRDLGYDTDALNAIAGVMEMYAHAAGASVFKLFCGLPILPLRSWEKHGTFPCGKTRACSFGTWFEYADPHEGASKAQEIGENDLTYSLVYSLTWRHWWGNRGGLHLEQARRSIFGSWTVAGWRTPKYQPGCISIFDSCLRIGVQFSGDELLDWEDDNPRILGLSRNGKTPLSLNIRGTVMDVRMEWKRRQMDNEPKEWKEGWLFTSPFEWHRDVFESPRWLFQEDESGKEREIGFLLLIVGCNYHPAMPDQRIVGMILRPVTRMLDGRTHTFYERLYCDKFELPAEKWPQMASLTREMEVRVI